ncbi:MAG: recombinational DNA repair protein (RecF pathway) [Flavobacteriaceae bacterium]|jgi:recombinational DNA repair protein (RecF pathway)
MYPVYQTEGFVVSIKNTGESNQYISVYTKEFGLIKGLLYSVRKIEGKLRNRFQLFSYIHVECIYGLSGWRFIHAHTCQYIPVSRFNDFSRIAQLVTRLCSGEEKNEMLFVTLVEYFSLLKEISNSEIADLECVAVFRMLYHLGYMNPKDNLEGLIDSPFYESMKVSRAFQADCIEAINTSLRETHL